MSFRSQGLRLHINFDGRFNLYDPNFASRAPHLPGTDHHSVGRENGFTCPDLLKGSASASAPAEPDG